MPQLQGYTLPTKERDFLEIFGVEQADMLAQHPESGADASVDESLDVLEVAGGR